MSLVNTLRHYRTFEAVATDGISIAYEDLGRGEQLVLLHGATENSENPGTRRVTSTSCCGAGDG